MKRVYLRQPLKTPTVNDLPNTGLEFYLFTPCFFLRRPDNFSQSRFKFTTLSGKYRGEIEKTKEIIDLSSPISFWSYPPYLFFPSTLSEWQ